MFAVVFGVLTAMVQSALRPVFPDWALTCVAGLLELSAGADALAKASLSCGAKFTLASFFLAFGGLSVQAQTRAVLLSAGLEELPVFLPKLFHALLAALVSVPVYALFRARLQTAQTASVCTDPFPGALSGLVVCAALCAAFRKMAGSNLRRDRV